VPATEPIGLISLVLVAGVGGFVLNMVNLWEDSKKPKAERVPKDVLYWVFFVFWPLAGAGLAWLYALDGSSLRPLLAFSIGLSAPTTIQAMVAKAAIRTGPPPNAEP
jgi:hypothetical protein